MTQGYFCDLPGVMQHFTVPAPSVEEDFFENGQMFDGSSIRGFQAIHESDMQLIPDPASAFVDPFRSAKTLAMNFSIVDPFTKEKYSRDPRNIAAKAEAYLKESGIADTVYFGPEAEFYVFDDVRFETKQNAGYYYIDSIEGAWNTGRVEDGGNRGYKTRYKGGYFPVPPGDHYADLRDSMVTAMMAAGTEVERAHHEVGPAGGVGHGGCRRPDAARRAAAAMAGSEPRRARIAPRRRVRVARRQPRPSRRRGHTQPPARRDCAPAVDTGVHPRRPAGRPRLRRR